MTHATSGTIWYGGAVTAVQLLVVTLPLLPCSSSSSSTPLAVAPGGFVHSPACHWAPWCGCMVCAESLLRSRQTSEVSRSHWGWAGRGRSSPSSHCVLAVDVGQQVGCWACGSQSCPWPTVLLILHAFYTLCITLVCMYNSLYRYAKQAPCLHNTCICCACVAGSLCCRCCCHQVQGMVNQMFACRFSAVHMHHALAVLL